MKHHTLSCLSAEHLRKPFKLHHRLRRRAKHPPPDGKEVNPPPAYDFIAAVEAAPVVNHWRPCRDGFNIAAAFG
jgi:hypothetical protein